MGPVAMLADHGDRVAVLEPGVEHHALAHVEAVDALADRLDHAGAVRAEDARLRDRGKPPADPDVQVVERGGFQPDEHLARACHGVGRLLDAEDLGSTVLVDACGEHGTILA